MAKFFNSLIDKLQSVADLKLNEVAFKIASEKEVKDLVIRLNTQGEKTSQLFELGEDSLGDSLGSYSPFTVEQKKKRGQPTNRITLKDTGEFYSSFNVVPYRGGFTIKANPIKEDSNLYDDFGADIVGLNETNLQILRVVYKEKTLEVLNEIL
ncbi:MAG: hypothetical protein MJH09_09740 [Cetobacterium sp.]|nr:hypothetical protein [Cetobacterium sp.]